MGRGHQREGLLFKNINVSLSSFAVVQMGFEYCNAKDYNKALTWVSGMFSIDPCGLVWCFTMQMSMCAGTFSKFYMSDSNYAI